MRLILTRHGETHHNVAKISMGQGVDGDLNELGNQQAQLLASHLKTESIDFIYTSPLKRAFNTAEAVAQFHPSATLISAPDLLERNLGIYEGTPNITWKMAMKNSFLPFHSFKPEQGESYEELQTRVSVFYSRLLLTHQNGTVLLVSHSGALTMLLLTILKRPLTLEEYEKYKPDNTAITIVELTGDQKIKLITLNSLDHLAVVAVS